jgi:hypothetical protein
VASSRNVTEAPAFFQTQRSAAVSAGCASKGCRADPDSDPLPAVNSLVFHRLFSRLCGPGLAPGGATRFRPRGFRCRPSRPISCSPSPRLPALPAHRPALSRRVTQARLRRSSAPGARRLPKRFPGRPNPRGLGQQARTPRRQRPQTISRRLERRRVPSNCQRRVTDRPVAQVRAAA